MTEDAPVEARADDETAGANTSHAAERDFALVLRSGLFDHAWYLAEFQDVAASGLDPLDHYLRHGGFEGRRASPIFDTAWYLAEYPDVPAAGMNPLVHYLRHGWREGRRPFSSIDGEKLRHATWDEAAGEPHPLLAEVATRRVPDFLRRQWREAAELELAIRPESGPFFTLPVLRFPREPALVEALERIRAEVAGDFTHVVTVPWMVRGGADLVAAHLVRAIQERHGPRAALLLATDHGARSAADWLPEGSRSLYFADVLPDATPAQLDALLTQFLLQYRPRAVLNVNSAACWRVLERYGRQLATFSRLYAFLFGYSYTATGAKCGPVVDHFRSCLPHMAGICTDSQFFRQHLIEQFGVVPADRARVKTIFSPVQDGARRIEVEALMGRLGRDRSHRRKVLWASRVAPEKDPAMLLAIVRAMPHMDFVAYGEAVLRNDNPLRDADLPNFDYRGGYANFFDLPLETFDLYLYTSLFDGMPTVLIAAQTAGLPIVAPGVGGVPEIANEATAWALPAGATLKDYCAALDAAAHAPERVHAKIVAGQERARRCHSWESYMAALDAEGLLAA
ncbi:MAG: hypothetical protein KIT16_16555 [Rhodospirillaceae bacterium]|nr:hypothetical protein [Rhodospirillaceae bacterium]